MIAQTAECACERRVVRWQNVRQGAGALTRHYRWQCLDCGAGSAFIAKAKVSYRDQIECQEFNQGIRDRYTAQLIEGRRQAEGERRELTEAQREERRQRYEDYIRFDPNWKRLRQLVRKRCGGICEGCGERPMSEVHHLTYDHLGDEFLWELRGVCRECHERFHGIEAFHAGVEDGAF